MTILEFQKKVADALNGLPLPSIITLMAAHAAVQDKRVDSMPGDAMSSDQNTCGRGGPPKFGVAGLCSRSFPAGLSPLDI